MPKSPFRLPKGGLTNSGKLLLRMRDGQGVSKRKLSREFNVSVRIVRKYLNEKKPTPTYTLSPDRKKSIESRRNKIEKILTPLDPAVGVLLISFLLAQSLGVEICKMQQKSAQTDTCTKQKGWVTFHWGGLFWVFPFYFLTFRLIAPQKRAHSNNKSAHQSYPSHIFTLASEEV